MVHHHHHGGGRARAAHRSHHRAAARHHHRAHVRHVAHRRAHVRRSVVRRTHARHMIRRAMVTNSVISLAMASSMYSYMSVPGVSYHSAYGYLNPTYAVYSAYRAVPMGPIVPPPSQAPLRLVSTFLPTQDPLLRQVHLDTLNPTLIGNRMSAEEIQGCVREINNAVAVAQSNPALREEYNRARNAANNIASASRLFAIGLFFFILGVCVLSWIMPFWGIWELCTILGIVLMAVGTSRKSRARFVPTLALPVTFFQPIDQVCTQLTQRWAPRGVAFMAGGTRDHIIDHPQFNAWIEICTYKPQPVVAAAPPAQPMPQPQYQQPPQQYQQPPQQYQPPPQQYQPPPQQYQPPPQQYQPPPQQYQPPPQQPTAPAAPTAPSAPAASDTLI